MGFFLRAILFIFLATSLAIVEAQTTAPLAYTIIPSNDGITIQGISPAGQLSSEIHLPFAVKNFGNSEWIVPSLGDFAVSPNARYLAFPAFRSENEIAVFIYDFIEGSTQEIPTPTLRTIIWSPSSDAIILQQLFNDFSLPSPDTPPKTYVYDLLQESLTQVTPDPVQFASPFIGSSFTWINNDQFIYRADGIPCGEGCRAFYDIYLGNRFGINTRPLTNLGEILPIEKPHTVCDLAWSERIQRLYFSVGCETNNAVRETLYSVDLAGNMRLEIDFASVYPYEWVTEVRSIIALSNEESVLIAIYAGSDTTIWRLIRLRGDGVFIELYEDTNLDSYQYLQMASLSPDESLILLAGNSPITPPNGSLQVLDIRSESADVLISREVGKLDVICELLWQDNDHVIFTQYESGNCYPASQPKSIVHLDLESNTLSTLVEDTGTAAILLPVPSNPLYPTN